MAWKDLVAHHPDCLGCGTTNPASMNIRFTTDGTRVRGSFTLDPRHEGAPGFAHGGAIATALDDTLGTLLILLGRPAVTAHLGVDYRAPALTGTAFVVEAWTDRIEGRKLHLAGELRTAEEGVLVAEARGLFLHVDVEHFAAGGRDLSGWVERNFSGDLPY